MEIKIREFQSVSAGQVVGIAEIEIGPVVVRNVRLVKRRDERGHFVGWPARRNQETETWTDLVYVPDRRLYDGILEALLAAGHKEGELPSVPNADHGGHDSVPF